MKLGGKTKDVDSFVDQLKSEGESVMSSEVSAKQPAQAKAQPVVPQVQTERYASKSFVTNTSKT